VDNLAGDVRRFRTGQENIRRSYFFGLTRALNRRVLSEPLNVLRVETGGDQRSPDWSWSDHVDSDSLLDEILSEGASERDNCTLSCGIIEQVAVTLPS
jgi:hypothetical protein